MTEIKYLLLIFVHINTSDKIILLKPSFCSVTYFEVVILSLFCSLPDVKTRDDNKWCVLVSFCSVSTVPMQAAATTQHYNPIIVMLLLCCRW